MFEVGRICAKLAGREARCMCVVVDVVDKNYVLIDGQVKRRKCNRKHLEPTDKIVKIKKGAAHADVVKELKSIGIEVAEKKKKEPKEKPKATRKKKEEPKKQGK